MICAVKANRRLNRKRMDHHNQSLRNQRYQRVTLKALDPSRPPRTYCVRAVYGHLEEVADEVRGIISKRHPGDTRPKFFVCTDCTLSVQQALQYDQRRWPVEVDNLYLKEALGLGDFRLQSFEATQKWFAVVVLAMNYLQYQAAVAYLQEQSVCSLAGILRQHRLAHWRTFLRKALTQLVHSGDIEATIESLLPAASWAVTWAGLRSTATLPDGCQGGASHLLIHRAHRQPASGQIAVFALVFKVLYAQIGETTAVYSEQT